MAEKESRAGGWGLMCQTLQDRFISRGKYSSGFQQEIAEQICTERQPGGGGGFAGAGRMDQEAGELLRE